MSGGVWMGDYLKILEEDRRRSARRVAALASELELELSALTAAPVAFRQSPGEGEAGSPSSSDRGLVGCGLQSALLTPRAVVEPAGEAADSHARAIAAFLRRTGSASLSPPRPWDEALLACTHSSPVAAVPTDPGSGRQTTSSCQSPAAEFRGPIAPWASPGGTKKVKQPLPTRVFGDDVPRRPPQLSSPPAPPEQLIALVETPETVPQRCNEVASPPPAQPESHGYPGHESALLSPRGAVRKKSVSFLS
jgi:hypothetical protein